MIEHPLTSYRKRTVPPKSKAEVAREIGVNRATIMRWESGKRRPEPRFLSAIARLTGAPIDQIMGLSDREGEAA